MLRVGLALGVILASVAAIICTAVTALAGAVAALGGRPQLALNQLIACDHQGNTALLGDPDETISHRLARLRDSGSVVGCKLCALLTRAFWFMHRDHCAWAEDSSVGIEREIIHWSPPK